MIHRALVIIAVSCCGLVMTSFGLFALDQVSGASSQQVHKLGPDAPQGAGQPQAQHASHQPRQFIDGAARTLTSPFSGVMSTGSAWAQRLVLTTLALLVYGFGLGYLARFSRGLA